MSPPGITLPHPVVLKTDAEVTAGSHLLINPTERLQAEVGPPGLVPIKAGLVAHPGSAQTQA